MRTFPAGSIAVVGNGPCEIGRGRGNEIDSHDAVIRFNNYSLSPEFENDYGSRVTHWASNFYPDIPLRDEKYDRIFCTVPMMDESFIRNNLDFENHSLPDYHALALAIYRADVAVVPYRVIEHIGVMSAGITLLAWMYFARGRSLDGIDVFGFSFFDQNADHHYFPGEIVGKTDHNGDVERKIYDSMRAKTL